MRVALVLGVSSLLVGLLLAVVPELSDRARPLGVSVPADRLEDPAVRRALRTWRLGCGVLALAGFAVLLGLGAATGGARLGRWYALLLLAQLAASLLLWTRTRRGIVEAKRKGSWFAGSRGRPTGRRGDRAGGPGRSARAGARRPVGDERIGARAGARVGGSSRVGRASCVGGSSRVGSSPVPDRSPAIGALVWFGAALGVLLVSAVVLFANYAALPDPFPSHWGANGVADAWTAKSPLAVAGSLLIGFGLLIVLGLVAWAVRRSAERLDPRQGARTRLGERAMGPLAFAMALVFALVSLLPLFRTERAGNLVLLASLAPIALVLLWLVVASVRLSRREAGVAPGASGEDGAGGAESDDDAHWLGGLVYANASDSRLLVPKRAGVGMTLNVGHPAGLALAIGMLVVLVVAVVLPFAL